MISFIKNTIIILHVLLITLYISILTILELSISKVPRITIDKRLRWWSKKLVDFIKLSYEVHLPTGFKIEKEKPYILMCNHSSHYDIPLSFLTFKNSIRMLAKKELTRIPIWGKGMRVSDFIAIDRTNARQAIKDLKFARKVMEKGIILWIAPEGTRAKDGKLQPFKSGGFRLAIQAKASIIPVGIVGSNEVMPSKTFRIQTGKHVDIFIGDPIETTGFTNRTKNELKQIVESRIRTLIKQ